MSNVTRHSLRLPRTTAHALLESLVRRLIQMAAKSHGQRDDTMVSVNMSLENTLQHDSVVCCVRYSSDGKFLATGSNRSARIFDAATGQIVATFGKDSAINPHHVDDEETYVRAVCFSPDGKWLVTGAEDHVAKVWDVQSRTVKHRLMGHEMDVYSVDSSPDSRFVVSGSGDEKAKIWNLETGGLMATLGQEHGWTDGISSVSVSPTSQQVAAGSLDKTVFVWDVETSILVRRLEGHRDSVYSVAFSPDGRWVLSGSLDNTLKLWDLSVPPHAGTCEVSIEGHTDFVLSVTFSPDGRWLISGSRDRTVQFWDPRHPTTCVALQGHENSVVSVAHNPLSSSLATGSGDWKAQTWKYE